MQLCYQGDDLELHGYLDADWACDLDNRKLTFGYVYILGGGAISWDSKKHTSSAISIVEVEYIAYNIAVQVVVWLRNFLCSLELIKEYQVVLLSHTWFFMNRIYILFCSFQPISGIMPTNHLRVGCLDPNPP